MNGQRKAAAAVVVVAWLPIIPSYYVLNWSPDSSEKINTYVYDVWEYKT